ncbi:MAG: M56 family metallopeptidase [Bacteroidota bacterium]
MMPLLVSLAIKGTVVLALGATAAALLKRFSASLGHCVWVATFVGLLAVPLLSTVGPAWRVEVLPNAAPVPASVSSTPPHDRAVALSPPEASGEQRSVSVVVWLGGLWILGTLAVGLLWLRGFALGHRIVRASQAMADPIWLGRLRSAARASGLTGPIRLRRSTALSVPVAWGWGSPTILLPTQSDAWDSERAHAVLLHEMAHLRRRDAWTQVIAQAALALHWPNPLAWLAYRQFLNTREEACDDAVLHIGAPPTAYASHLVAIARELSPSRLSMVSATPLVGPNNLEGRIHSIIDTRRRRVQPSRWTVGATLALAFAVGGPLAAFQPVERETQLIARESQPAAPLASASSDSLAPPELPVPLDMPVADARGTISEMDATEPVAVATEQPVVTSQRNASLEERIAETEAANAATEALNAETYNRNVLTQDLNTAMEDLNATVEALNAAMEDRNRAQETMYALIESEGLPSTEDIPTPPAPPPATPDSISAPQSDS